MHWLTQPATSRPEETRISVRACKDLREIPGVRNCGSHIGQALLGRRGLRRRLRRELDQRRPGRRLRQDARRGPPDGRGLPGPLPRRPDLPARAHQGGADRDERVDRRAHLRPRPRRPARRRPTRSRSAIARHRRASSTRTPTSPTDLPHIEVELDLAAARALRPQARRRPPAVLDAAGQRGGRRHLPRRQGLRRARVEHPVGARQRDRRREPPDRHAERAAGPRSSEVADVRHRADAERHRARAAVAPDRRRRQRRRAATSPPSSTRSRSALEGVEFPLGYHAEVLGESHRAERRAGPPAAVRHRSRRS